MKVSILLYHKFKHMEYCSHNNIFLEYKLLKIKFRSVVMKVNKKASINILILILVTIISVVYSNESTSTWSNQTKQLPIYSVKTDEKKIALTFDVNWAEKEYIYDILDVLEEGNAKGTFFIMGGWVNYSDENREKLMKISDGGNEIGNHSYKHPSFSKIDENRIVEELKKTDDTIEKYTGEKPKLFRFPSGDFNKQSLNVVKSNGYIPIQWNVDSVDWKEQGADVEYKRVIDKIKPGSILLFHNNAKYTPKNLERLLEKLTEDGYEFVKISELIYHDETYIDNNGVQYRK